MAAVPRSESRPQKLIVAIGALAAASIAIGTIVVAAINWLDDGDRRDTAATPRAFVVMAMVTNRSCCAPALSTPTGSYNSGSRPPGG